MADSALAIYLRSLTCAADKHCNTIPSFGIQTAGLNITRTFKMSYLLYARLSKVFSDYKTAHKNCSMS